MARFREPKGELQCEGNNESNCGTDEKENREKVYLV